MTKNLKYFLNEKLLPVTLTNYFDYLEDNLLNYLLDKEDSHQLLCIYKLVCVSFQQEIMKIETKRYLREILLLKGILDKINVGIDMKYMNTSSLELFKLSLDWDDNIMKSLLNKKEDILEIFDCNYPCYSVTEPIENSNIKCFSEEEYEFLSLHFYWNWWEWTRDITE